MNIYIWKLLKTEMQNKMNLNLSDFWLIQFPANNNGEIKNLG